MECVHLNYLGECAWHYAWSGDWMPCGELMEAGRCPGKGPEKGEVVENTVNETMMVKRLMDGINARNVYNLSQWEIDFIRSIRGRIRWSERQKQKLYDIYIKKVPG